MEKKHKGSGKIAAVIGDVIIYALCIAIILGAVLFAADKNPQKSLLGYRYYTVLTPSMTPTYKVGDVVLVRVSDDVSQIQAGDVITFNPSSASESYLTHRVTEVIENYEGSGVTYFRTKGDANDTEDSFLIEEDRVIGIVTFSIPKLGYLIRFVQLKWYYVIPLVLLMFLLAALLKRYRAAALEEASQPEPVSGDESAVQQTKATEQTAQEKPSKAD